MLATKEKGRQVKLCFVGIGHEPCDKLFHLQTMVKATEEEEEEEYSVAKSHSML